MLFIIKAAIAFIQEAKYDYRKKKTMHSKDLFVIVILVGSVLSSAATISKTLHLSASLKEQKQKVAQLEDLLKSKNLHRASSDSGNNYTDNWANGISTPNKRTDCLSPYCIP